MRKNRKLLLLSVKRLAKEQDERSSCVDKSVIHYMIKLNSMSNYLGLFCGERLIYIFEFLLKVWYGFFV